MNVIENRLGGRKKRQQKRNPKVPCRKLGAPGRIRTRDPLVRSQVLYPTELPARRVKLCTVSHKVARAMVIIFSQPISALLLRSTA